jgi:Zn-dependent M28 family amino/carboxypeptidase
MVMELARYYATQSDPRVNYLFIAFDGEEKGLLGSEHYAGHPSQPLDSALFMFNFDMVGRLGAKGNRVESVGTASSKAWNRITRESKPVPFNIKKIPGAGPFSDHDGFYKRGLPIAYLTTGMHDDYHTNRDVAVKINYTGMAEIAGFAQRITENAENAKDLKYRKVSGWNQFRSMWYYVFEQLDHVLTVGMGDIE